MLEKKKINKIKNKKIINRYYYFYFIPEASAFRDW